MLHRTMWATTLQRLLSLHRTLSTGLTSSMHSGMTSHCLNGLQVSSLLLGRQRLIRHTGKATQEKLHRKSFTGGIHPER
eukprot:scaffold7410_cov17-Tisochrysis_lutea.AAC.1